MANSMNFNLDYGPDESQDSGGSQPLHDPSYMAFPAHVDNYAFSAMLPQDVNLPVQSFERPPQDLEGRMSNVMLAYDSMPNPVSMPTNLDPNSAYAYSIPTTYPATSMG